MGQTSNVKDEEINGDNIPLNKLYKHHHIAKNIYIYIYNFTM